MEARSAPLDDPRLASAGDAGALLASMARTRGEELVPLREGASTRPEHVAALLVRP